MTTETNRRPPGTRWCKTGIALALVAAVLTAIGLAGGRTGSANRDRHEAHDQGGNEDAPLHKTTSGSSPCTGPSGPGAAQQ